MTIFLGSLGLKNYRGIGPQVQRMSDFQRFNILIGSNNAGKSCVLNFISKYLPIKIDGGRVSLAANPDALERHSTSGNATPEFEFSVPAEDLAQAVIDREKVSRSNSKDLLLKLTQSIADLNGLVWLRSPVATAAGLRINGDEDISQLMGLLTGPEWNELWLHVSRGSGGNIKQHWIPDILRKLRNSPKLNTPSAKLIPAIRNTGPKGHEFSDFSGKGLIDHLARLACCRFG